MDVGWSLAGDTSPVPSVGGPVPGGELPGGEVPGSEASSGEMDAGRGGVPVVGPGLGQAEASFTLALPLHGRRVLVVGGGTAATQTVTALRAAGAIARVVSPTLSPALTELAARGLIEVASRQYQMRDLTDAWLAFACSD